MSVPLASHFSLSGSHSDGSQDPPEWARVLAIIEYLQQHPEFAPPERLSQAPAMLGHAYTLRYLESEDLHDLQAAILQQETVRLSSVAYPNEATLLESLAVLFTQRYNLLGDQMDLDSAVQRSQELVDLTPADHPERAKYLCSLAGVLRNRYQRLGGVENLEVAVQRSQEAVDLTPSDHPKRAEYLQDLAQSIMHRIQRFGDLEDRRAAIRLYQEALEFTPVDHAKRADRLHDLSVALGNQYQRCGNLEDLETAMHNAQEAVNLIPKDHPDRPQHLQNLAVAFSLRYHRFGNLKDLEVALETNQEAVDLTLADDPDRSLCLQDLAHSFILRYERLGNLSDLDAAMQRFQEAVDLVPAGHPDRAHRLRTLAVSFTQRYHRLGHLMDLETAVKTNQEAVDLTPVDHPERPRRLGNLAVSLMTRYRRLGDLMDLEAAVLTDREAVDLTPADHIERPRRLEKLAISLLKKYERLGDTKDLNAALQRNQEALDLTPADDPDRAGYLESLAGPLTYQFLRSGDLKDLDNALKAHQEAVDRTPEDHAKWPGRLNNLGISFNNRYSESRDLKDLEAAVQRTQQAVDLTPENHPDHVLYLQGLAFCLTNRYRERQELRDLENIHRYYATSFTTSASNDPESSWKAALVWASFSQEFQPSNVPTAYRAAFKILPDILWMGNTIPVRHDAIRRLRIGPVASIATKSCVKLKQLKPAMEILEQGLATTFQQILQLKPDVDKLLPQQAKDLRQLSLQLYSGTASNPREAAAQRKYLLDDIRKQPGLEYFMLPRPYNVLCHAADHGPVVILNSHADSCDGIIILNTSSEPVHVSFSSITLKQLHSEQKILKELLGRCNVRTRDGTVSTRLFGHQEGFKSKTTEEYFEEILTWLWKNVVNPVYQILASHGIYQGRLWWLPTGAFTGLPLHAGPPISDQFIHSYTATLGSLLEAQPKKLSNTAAKVGIVGVTYTDSGGRNYLKGVKDEIKKISSVINNHSLQCLEGEHATPEAVKFQLKNCSWIHLACHGTQDLYEPTKSCLLLYEGKLELETILRMSLSNAQFVFLAACQTAMGDAELINESFHLGGGFIAAGFQSAVGTLWSMNDQDGPLVAEIFYSYLFRDGQQPKADETANALQLAVRELRNRKVPYERWVPFIHMGV
ncbi:CHAT domain-containing protein [Mycena maculata]|uniref:CHAT domain-containing protein n=1 Tax=Mycena maculata TaxID=230809 RepID=A0AAD7NLP6_9AGAR|nr:CHAT domain-containing protein [Mycena maculata]